ncbi:hypothetical protein BST81_23445 [Leptolyngbya sp. 'hensonii']|uniref:DUF4079 domain-containing protein n=1 Tax=Leptolyngbya sp. 'hensonii' TaxID=1922337 RepID=UPI00094F4C44|nr:DUF4079 domain-containing protein [Leptolyngbya sp. 'hensonii']OLP16016.1 hypothetical protein BST81_23445 [Leptolyngbya sp. 'hensonii']
MSFEIPENVKVWSQFFHPLLMWVVLAIALYALYTGIQVIRTRSADGDAKKALVQGKFNTKHYQIGSLLLALMTLGTLGGMAVTYINNGKLFVGPHLLAGLGMVGMMSVSASLSPYMQKGANWARLTHILLNVTLLGLFGWQAATGIQIVQRILEKMQTA